MQSHDRSNLVTMALEGYEGWHRDPYAAQCVADWTERFPDLPIVADGRRCKPCREAIEQGSNPAVCGNCYKSSGRGTTAFDMFRRVGYRADFLSIKTDTIEKSGKLPSKLSLSTGNEGTLEALLSGIMAGNGLATVVFASKKGENGPENDGLALFLDLGTAIRAGSAFIEDYKAEKAYDARECVQIGLKCEENGDSEGAETAYAEGNRLMGLIEQVSAHGSIPCAPKGGWGKGKAPKVYLKWSSRRKCGDKHKKAAREGWTFPCVDEKGRKWSAPDYVHYRELVVSISAMGIRRKNWIPASVSDLPQLCEDQDWNGISWGDSELVG